MARKIAAKAKGRKKSRNPRRINIINTMAPNVLADSRVRAWDQLLRDPCAANLVSPCYGGTDAGYLVRTTDYFDPNITTTVSGTTGQATTANLALQWCPHQFSAASGLVWSGDVSSAPLPAMQHTGFSTFVGSASIVKRFRPVASCLKFIPTGEFAKRSGVIGLGYNPGMILENGELKTVNQVMQLSQHVGPVGEEPHEVRWLPTSTDENFVEHGGAATSISNTTGGAVFASLRNVHAIYTAANTIKIQGFFEITTVWEWVPDAGWGLAAAPKAPLPYTSQQVLSTIGDLGAYIFQGVRVAGEGMVKAGVRTAVGMLTRGVSEYVNRGAGMPLLTYH